MEAKKRIENDPAIGEVLFHDDDCLIKVIHQKVPPESRKWAQDINIFSFRYCTIWKIQRKCHRVIEILFAFTILSKMEGLTEKAKGLESKL